MGQSYIHSPLIFSNPLSEKLNKNIYLKLEMLQPSGSFKDRGIGHLCESLANENGRGFVSSSGGNAGMAVAYAAKRLNLPATVIIPKTTSNMMVEKLQNSGAKTIIHGENWNEADELAHEKTKELGLNYIPPFDHPLIWEGYQNLVSEFKEDNFKPQAIILAVGGGGLYAGIMQGLYNLGWYDVDVITAETQGAASLAKAVKASKRIKLDKIETIAGTLGAKQIAAHAFEWTQKHPPKPQILSDKQAVSSCLKFAEDHRLLVEPACGAALSVVYDNLDVINDYNDICIIVCGGNGVNIDLLRTWQQQFEL